MATNCRQAVKVISNQWIGINYGNSCLPSRKNDRDKSISANVYVGADGVTVELGRRNATTYEWDEISVIEVEGPETVQKRVTASRLLLTGPLAFAMKKKTGDAYLFISFHDGREPVVLRFPKKSQPELKVIISPYLGKVKSGNSSEPSTDVENQLAKLGQFFEQGLIEADEYKASKAKILGI